jgi:soluble lytic murein transglycosylase-like protein
MKKLLLAFIILIVSRISFSIPEDNIIHYAAKYDWMTVEIYQAIEINAEKHNIPPALGAALINRESQGNPKARGKAGERGLGQPLVCHYSGDPDDLFIPAVNLDVSFSYLFQAYHKAKGNIRLTLMYYNGGLKCKADKYKNWNYVEDIINEYRPY